MGCSCDRPTCLLPIILGIVGGLLAVFFGTFTNIIPFLWIAFGIAAATIVILTSVAVDAGGNRDNDTRECICKNGVCVLVGALGTLVTSIIAITLGALSALLTFLVVGFLVWVLVALALWIICIIKGLCN